ncbi:MAG: DNA-processing protein DprA [Bacillota bacterium]
MNKRKYWLGLIKLQGLGPKLIKNLIDFFGDAHSIWQASQEELCQVNLVGAKRSRQIIKDRAEIDLDYELEQLDRLNINFLTLTDSDYPSLLKNIYDPPPVLFYQGTLNQQDLISLSIVGSRKCTTYGRRVAERLADNLAQQGFTIVSGLARGIDTAAHQGALQGGRTLAVLGSGLDVIYPPENKELAAKVSNQGALLSAFPVGTSPVGSNFPQRNRIISGLSLGTIVVEAAQKSGSLITANYALNQGREVFAIPGDITRVQSVGTNQLIQVGAKLVQKIDDIIEELPLEGWHQMIENSDDSLKSEEIADLELSSMEEQVYNHLSSTPQDFDQLVVKSKVATHKLHSILLQLEIKGLVEQLAGNRFRLDN